MKLNKFKVGLTLVVLLSVLLLSTSALAVTQDGDRWIIENQSDFNKLTGNNLSSVDFDGDGAPDIEEGDTIALGSASFTQTASITIDRQNITIEPTQDVMDSDNVTTLTQEPSSPYDDGNKREIDTGYSSGSVETSDVSSSIVITKEGTHVRNLNFEPTGDVEETIDNAILVDIQDPCACETRGMVFENLQIPTCAANGNFNYGIRFTGVIESYGVRSTDYSGVEFYDVRIDGVVRDGVNFADSVGDVSDLHFEQFYAGSCGSNCIGGFGLYFNNHGKVENVNMEDSDNLGTEQQSRYGIEKSQDGIRVNGASVTKVSGFEIEDFEIKNNCDNGIFIKGNWNNDNEAISLIDLTVKDTEISENGEAQDGTFSGGFGVLIGDLMYGDGDYPDVTGIHYSPAKLDKVMLGNVQIFNNISGGAGLFASKVAGSDDGVEVKDSRFNTEVTGDGENDQGFGLTVAAYEGIDGLEISNSEFQDHDGELSGVTISGLPAQNFSDGIALLAAHQDGAYDDVEDVSISNTEASNNDTSSDNGNGLRIEGKTVDGVEVAKVGKFDDNGKNGIKIFGEEGVNDVTIEDGDADSVREITGNGNGKIGLLVESDSGNITDLSVTDAEFGTEGHKNKDSGIKVVTNQQDGNIGSSDSDGAVSFENVVASYNLKHGMEINSAGDFDNPSQNVVVGNSEFNYNHKDGLQLVASGDVKRPRIENSYFVGNNVDSTYSAGLYIEFGGDLSGSANVSEISGNVLAGNEEGLTVKPPKPNTPPTGSITNFSVRDNTTYYAGNEEEYNGNVERNIGLIAGQLNSVKVLENIVVGEETQVGLLLRAEDSSSAVSVTENIFRTGAEGACIGLGTAIVLDAWNTDINHNEIDGYSSGVEVLEEKQISSADGPSDTSNHINNNNIVGCCTTIDASELESKSGDGDLYMVDATENYWGPDVNSVEDAAVNIVSPEHVFLGNVLDSPVVVIEILSVNQFKSVTSDPKAGETVELQFKLKNVSDSKISGQTVRMIVEDPDGNVIINTEKENVPELNSGKVYTNTHSFLPTQKGEYTATLEVDRGAVTKSIMVDVAGTEPGPTPEPDNYTPDWGKSGIMPAPIDGDGSPELEITNEEGNTLNAEDVDDVTIRVFSVSGKKLDTFDAITGLDAINDLDNGLYLYTVDITTDEDYQSPVKKFVVKQ